MVAPISRHVANDPKRPSLQMWTTYPIVHSDPLQKEELAVARPIVCQLMVYAGCDLKAVAGSQVLAGFWQPRINRQIASQHEIVVRYLAMTMPWDDPLRSEREKSRADDRIGHDGLNLFHCVPSSIRRWLVHNEAIPSVTNEHEELSVVSGAMAL
jgi:hypothetical protein